MASKLPAGRCRVTLSFEGAADDVSLRLIAFLKELPAEEAAEVLRGLQRSMRGGTP